MRVSPLLRALLAMLLVLGGAGAARAACTVSSPGLTFTQGSSYDVQAMNIASVSGSAGLSCSGTAISVLGSSYANATVTSANNFTLKVNGTGDAIPYQVSADSGGTTLFTQGGTVNYMNSSLLSLLNILNTSSFAPMMYAKITAGPNVAAGTYTDTLTLNWSYKICNGVQIAGICVGYLQGTGTSTILVTVVVGNDCRINAPALSFGSAPLASQFSPVTQAVATDCTKGTVYKVSFTSGGNGNSRPWRTMSDGNGHTLQYNIYQPDGATIWDETNPTTTAAPGTGATTPAQMQAYVAKINTSQITPPAGHYTDTVSVVISF